LGSAYQAAAATGATPSLPGGTAAAAYATGMGQPAAAGGVQGGLPAVNLLALQQLLAAGGNPSGGQFGALGPAAMAGFGLPNGKYSYLSFFRTQFLSQT